jgi:hypothetical protein
MIKFNSTKRGYFIHVKNTTMWYSLFVAKRTFAVALLTKCIHY